MKKERVFKVIFFLLLVISWPASSSTRKTEWDSSQQMVLVITKSWDATQGILQLYEKKGLIWNTSGKPYPVVIGKYGMKWGDKQNNNITEGTYKKEGDNFSPAGRYWLLSLFSENKRTFKMPYQIINQDIKCVDDPDSGYYNKIVDEKKVKKDWKSAEDMLRKDNLYKTGIVVGYNPSGTYAQGSCIFLHIWRSASSPTAGCTAMTEENINWLANQLDPEKKPMLVQLPETEYHRLRDLWHLP